MREQNVWFFRFDVGRLVLDRLCDLKFVAAAASVPVNSAINASVPFDAVNVNSGPGNTDVLDDTVILNNYAINAFVPNSVFVPYFAAKLGNAVIHTSVPDDTVIVCSMPEHVAVDTSMPDNLNVVYSMSNNKDIDYSVLVTEAIGYSVPVDDAIHYFFAVNKGTDSSAPENSFTVYNGFH